MVTDVNKEILGWMVKHIKPTRFSATLHFQCFFIVSNCQSQIKVRNYKTYHNIFQLSFSTTLSTFTLILKYLIYFCLTFQLISSAFIVSLLTHSSISSLLWTVFKMHEVWICFLQIFPDRFPPQATILLKDHTGNLESA